MKNPVRRIAVRFLAVAVVAVLCSSGLAADPPVKPGDGFGVFLVVFRQMYEGSDQGQGRLDVAKFGGVEHEKRDGVLVVTLPLQAWADVEAHPDVAYVQRVWMGEPLDDWTAGRAPKDRLRTSTNAALEAEVPAAVWDSADYAYDGSGNITAIGNDQYAYDSAGRIIQSTVGGVAETYGYDSFGNLVAKTTGTRAASIPPVDPGSNRFTGYRYDAAGNVLSLPGSGVTLAERASSYEYDSLGMPTTVSGHTGASETRRMIYTADDERIASIEDGDNSSAKIWLRGFDGKVLREYRGKLTSSNWVWLEDYVYASGQLLAAERESSNGGRLHFHLDHLGSTRLITKADKTELSAHRFFPFGVEQSDSTYELKNFDLEPWRLEPMKFTGHERDFYGPLNVDGTDHLDYMHARFYDPGIGRFLSPDPVLGNLLQPQSWNRYAYVMNNPTNLVDPFGLAARRPGEKVQPGDTCDGKAVDGWCTGDTITVETDSDETRARKLGERMLKDLYLMALRADQELTLRHRDAYKATTQGMMGFVDGVNPFGDPLQNTFELYGDGSVDGLEASKMAGLPTQWVATSVIGGHAIRVFGLGKNSALFAKTTGILNRNDYLRVGWSWRGSRTAGAPVFRAVIGGRNTLKGVPAWLRHMDFW